MNHPIDRRTFLGLLGAGAAAAALPGRGWSAPQGQERPDVLFIVAEDFKTALGCYGNPVVKAPNLDALAASGMRFDNAQCAFPVCCPTRASLASGLSPRTHRVMGNATDWSQHLALGSTMPEYFRDHGYEAVCVGKFFHEGNGDQKYDSKPRWSRTVWERQGLPPIKNRRRPGHFLYDHLSPEEREKVYDTRAWEWGATGQDDLEMSEGAIAEQGIRLLTGKREKPLFLVLGFHKTHLPLLAPDRYFDLYPPDKIPLPDDPEDCLKGLPRGYGLANHKAFTPEKRRQAIAAYYACTSYMDASVGRVLDALKQTGRDRKTIIVFVGDHGFHLGEHLLWQKMTLFEESCRVPLMIRVPGVTRAGSVCRRPAEQYDLFPTLADACGLGVPEGLDAVSMLPLLRDPARPWKKGAMTVMGPGTSVRAERWRYHEWGGPDKAELYDHDADPREMKNLAGDPKHKDVTAELSALIRAGAKANRPG